MAILDNTPTPLANADVGIKISKPYYDASRTQPQNLIFSSSWPSLPIAFELNIPDASTLAKYQTSYGGSYAIPHNLKYPPLAFFWQRSDVSGKNGLPSLSLRSICDADNTYVYIKPVFSIQSNNLTPPINIKCFGIDLRQDIDYPSTNGDTLPSAYDPDYGIKVCKFNKDVDSKDLRDFILHSRAQSPLILAVKTQKTANGNNPTTIQYTSKLPYPVWVYGFVKQLANQPAPLSNADYYQYAPYFNQAFPRTQTNGVVSSIAYGSNAAGATLVILRDPMFASLQETAQYLP